MFVLAFLSFVFLVGVVMIWGGLAQRSENMQLIGEAYQLLKTGLDLSTDEFEQIFTEWNKGELDSFLIEITATIFGKKDEDGSPVVDKILDTAGQKGTGKWTAIDALDANRLRRIARTNIVVPAHEQHRYRRVPLSPLLDRAQRCVGVLGRGAGIEGELHPTAHRCKRSAQLVGDVRGKTSLVAT